MRYVRAFFIALWWTIRGRKPPAPPHPRLSAWVREGIEKVNMLYAAAAQYGFDKNRRESIRLRIEGRDVSMEVIIAAAEHNLVREYPRLIRLQDEHSLTVIYASNMNDQYRMMKLAEAPEIQDSSVKEAVRALQSHLESIPPSTET